VEDLSVDPVVDDALGADRLVTQDSGLADVGLEHGEVRSARRAALSALPMSLSQPASSADAGQAAALDVSSEVAPEPTELHRLAARPELAEVGQQAAHPEVVDRRDAHDVEGAVAARGALGARGSAS